MVFVDWLNMSQQFPPGDYPDFLGGRVVSAKFGDLIVLGGLTENKETGNTTGVSFLPQLFGRSNSVASTDVLVLIQLDGV